MENRMEPRGEWLVVGADGQIGQRLLRRLQAEGRPAVGTTRRDSPGLLPLDLAGPPQQWQLPERVAVAYLCAAIASIDKCESDPVGTRLINVERTLELVERLHARGGHVVFLSTNQVFNGAKPMRSEKDAVCPLTEYGRQKAEVEAKLLAGGRAAIVRFTKVVVPGWKLIGDWAAALGQGEPIAAFADMVMAPVPAAFAVEALTAIGAARATGIFHVSGERDISYLEVALRLAKRIGASRDLVRPMSIAERKITRAAAPLHTTLDAGRLRREFGLACPPAIATLDEVFETRAV